MRPWMLVLIVTCWSCDNTKHKSSAKADSDPPRKAQSASASVAPSGAASSATAPGAPAACTPECVDGTHAKTCDAEGRSGVNDCNVKNQRCLRGVCSPRLCEPNKLHCYDSSIYQCNAEGSSRTLQTPCGDGVCFRKDDKDTAKCVTTCGKDEMNVAYGTYNCEACDWSSADFCAQSGPEHGCSEKLCVGGEFGFGVANFECTRETDGLIVPETDKRGTCDPSKKLIPVDYEICVAGKHEKRIRTEACNP